MFNMYCLNTTRWYCLYLSVLSALCSTEKPVSPKGTQLTKNYYSVVSEL